MLRGRRVLLLTGLPLTGCSSTPAAINPVSWWHDLQGGAIAQQRPPPPGANAPYPNLASVPPKPAAPNQQELASITQGLVADRAHADYLAASSPVNDPSSPTASPALFGQGTMPPPPPAAPTAPAGTASASLPAASAPPLPRTTAPVPANGIAPPPNAAPLGSVQSTPLAPPPAAARPMPATARPTPAAAQPMPAAAQPTPAAASPAQAAPAVGATGTAPPNNLAANAPLAPPGTAVVPPPASVPPPSLPTTPPAPPSLAGPGAPMATPSKFAAAAPLQAPRPANATEIEFVGGSATLPTGAAALLKDVAAKRGGAVIAVTGYGEATSDDPSVQSAALSLGLSRAQAVANVLTRDGVPQADVRVGAEAAGRGASVRLVQ